MNCGVRSYQASCAGGNECFSIFPTSRRSRMMEKNGKAGGSKEWKNKQKESCGLARAGSTWAGTSKAWHHPWGLCSRQRQPRL